MTRWNYLPIEDETRRSRLKNAPPFSEIAQSIADNMSVLCTHTDPCGEATGFMRIVACVSVGVELFDLFFNAESGYRGSYFVSPTEGLAANGHLLKLIAAPLANFSIHPEMQVGRAECSLRMASAKAWLAEAGPSWCPKCEGEWTTPQDAAADILNGRWECADDVKARYGRKAPQLTLLRVMGGFINQSKEEYVALRKRRRAEEINEFGWS